MSKYIADKSYFKRPKDGRFIRLGNPEIEVGKSYTFDIKPRYDVEKGVKLIIFIIPDLQEAVNNGILSVSDASNIWYAGLIPDTNNPGQFRSPDLSGQAIAYVELINLPIVNPKNGSNLESYLDGKLEEKFISFNPTGLKQSQVIYPGETSYRTTSGNKINTIDEYIDDILITAQNTYQINIYQILVESEEDIMKLDLPDNKVEFTQEFLSEEETTNIDESSEPVVEEAIILNDITFKIDQNGDITNDKLGKLKIIQKIEEEIVQDLFDFGDDEQDLSLLGEEFTEDEFAGKEESFNEILDESTGPGPDDGMDSTPVLLNPNSKLLSKSSSGRYYIVDTSNGLAGKRLRKIMTELELYLSKQYPGTKIGFNGIMRDLVASTYPNNPARAVASLHGAGLAIDVTFNIPGKVWNGIGDNKNLASDEKLSKLIYEYTKSQGDITWGGQWGAKSGTKPESGIIKGWGITEYHHFEIKAGNILDYWKPFKDEIIDLGIDFNKLNKVGSESELFKLNKILLKSVNIFS